MVILLILAVLVILFALWGTGKAVVYTGKKVGWIIPKENKLQIAVFGLPQTGKTLFFNYLRKKWDVENEQTSRENIRAFKIKQNDMWFKIKDTIDMGGGDAYFRENCESLVETSNFIIYFCNIHDYMNKDEVARKDKARMQHIYNCMLKYKKNIDKNGKDLNIVRVVLSYSDKVKDREAAQNFFVNSIRNEKFSTFAKYVIPVDMTDNDDKKELLKLLFPWKE